MNKISVDIINDDEGFEGLKDQWNALLKHSVSDCLFLTWEWLFTWWKHFSDNCQLHIITLREGETLIAIAPFTIRSRRWKRLLPFQTLEFLGTGAVGSDYLDILIRQGYEDRVHTTLAEYLAEDKHMLSLPSVEKNASQACEFARRIALRGWSATQIATDVCPYIDLSDHSWESYLSSLSSAHRRNINRRKKNLHKSWDIKFELVKSEQQRPEALRLLMTLHGKRWHTRGLPGVFFDPTVVAFHEEISQRMLALGGLRLYILRMNGEPVAAIYGFQYNHEFYYYQSGFNPDYQRYSVGLVAMAYAIQNAIGEQVKLFDFLRGDESYKFLWTRDYRELIRLELYPTGVRGTFYRQAMQLRSNICKLIQPVPKHASRNSAQGIRDAPITTIAQS